MSHLPTLPCTPRAPSGPARCAARWAAGGQLRASATLLGSLVLLGCASLGPRAEPRAAQGEASRTQAKLEDRLRRVEGRLQLVDAQLSVLREQGRFARAADAARIPPGEDPGTPPPPRTLRLGEAPYAGDALALTYPEGQRIVTDAAGRVTLVANEAPALEIKPGNLAAAAAAAGAQGANVQAAAAGEPAFAGEKKRVGRSRAARSKRSSRSRAPQ